MSKYEGVADTLFIPLAARIYVSRHFPEYFYDVKALELEERLPDHSIERKSSEYSMVASAARYYNLDEMVERFWKQYPQGNLVNLGCGLETAYFRLREKKACVYEIDLPEVIRARRELLGEGENERLIEGNLFDLAWTRAVQDTERPTLMVASGVFQYFHEEEILSFIQGAREVFKEAQLIFDATDSKGILYTNRYVKKTGNTSAQMYFYVDDATSFARKASCTLLEERPFYTDARRILRRKAGLYTRVAMKVCDDQGRAKILWLKL